jgi:hypothetical protein
VVFYRLSNEASKTTTEAAKGIAASVERLEKLFDKLYSDTFSMMRDTVADMRKHMWPEEVTGEQENALTEVEGRADKKVEELKKEMESKLQTLLAEQKLGQEQNKALRSNMRRLLDQAMLTSRNVEVEAREETLREHILRAIVRIERTRGRATIDDVVSRLSETFPTRRIIAEITRLRDESLVELLPDEVNPGSKIRLQGSRDAITGQRRESISWVSDSGETK